MFNFFTKKNKGFTLIETLFYLSVFLILSIATINAVITMTRSLKQVTINNELFEASFILEKITKTAGLVNGATFSDNQLVLPKEISGNYKFIFSDNDIVMYEDDVLTGQLNPNHLKVESFSVDILNTPKGNALKMSLSVSHKSLPTKIHYFYTTVLLKGVY